MKVNFNKVGYVQIEDKDGNKLDNFALKGASYMEHKLHENVLTLRKTT